MTGSTRAAQFCYILLLAAHLALVWLLPFFPSQDGPSHLYNLYVLHDLLNSGTTWGNYFSATPHFAPNLGFTLIAYPLASILPPLVTEKLFLSIYIALIGATVPVLMKSLDRPVFPFSYFGLPVIFNHSLLMGFYSYTITVPLFILGFCLAWKVRSRSLFTRFTCFNLTGLIIFYCHIIPFIFFLIAVASITLAEEHGLRKKAGILGVHFMLLIPSILAMIGYLMDGSKRKFHDFSYLVSPERLVSLIKELFSFSTVLFSRWQALPAALFISLAVIIIYSSLKDLWLTRQSCTNIRPSEKALVTMASVLIIAYLLAPFRFGDGSYFNQRFPWVILLILLPLFRLPALSLLQRFGPMLIAVTATAIFASNAVALYQESTKVTRFVGGCSADIPGGAFVMAYKIQNPEVDVLMHAASYYGLFKECVDIGNYEARLDYFQVRFRNDLPPFPSQDQIAYEPGTIRWSDYPSIQYLLAWDLNHGDEEKIGRFFTIIWNDRPMTIWKRKSTGI
jgi:hypothetical protein